MIVWRKQFTYIVMDGKGSWRRKWFETSIQNHN